MQDDNEQKIEDEIIGDEDFDLAEFDDDLADDDSWDEFDDSAPESTIENEKSEESSAPTKDSFLKKNFNLIAIVSVVLIGGVFVLNQMGSSPSSEQTTDIESSQFDTTKAQSETPISESITDLSSDAGLPPMPAPISTAAEDNIEITESSKMDIMDDLDSFETALTPMPVANEPDNVMLSELSIDEVQAVPVSDKMLNVADMAAVDFDPVMMDMNTGDDDNLEPIQSKDNPDSLMADLSIKSHKLSSQTNALPEMSASETNMSTDTIASDQMRTLENRINNKNNMLSEKIVETNSKLDELVNSISALEKRLDKLAMSSTSSQNKVRNTAMTETKSMSSPKSPAHKPVQNQMVKSEMSAKPAKSMSMMSTKTKWKLRSAQPGKALVAAAGSNDMITVHVGDTLPGIGRISDITIENNKWVIRGTHGLISQ